MQVGPPGVLRELFFVLDVVDYEENACNVPRPPNHPTRRRVAPKTNFQLHGKEGQGKIPTDEEKVRQFVDF